MRLAALIAHVGAAPRPHDFWQLWSFEPLVIGGLIGAGALYFRGVNRLWRNAGRGRGLPRWRALCFGLGLLALMVALVSPLDGMGSALFAAHMTQHAVLMLVAAPLLVLGDPLVAMLWALPRRGRLRIGGWLRLPLLRAAMRGLTRFEVAWLINAAVLWIWHAPAAYQAALRSSAWHGLQHTSFLLAAFLFWWLLLAPQRATARYLGVAFIFSFTTMIQTSALGALLTFSPTAIYPAYQQTTGAWGLSALEDQQLAGLIMWVPGGFLYLLVTINCFAAWLRALERRQQTAAYAEIGAVRRRHEQTRPRVIESP